MDDYDYYEIEVEKLDRDAVGQLVERHRAEYEELKAATLTARISELEMDVRRSQQTVEELRKRLAKAEEDKKRWAQRVADGITVRADG